VRELEAPVVEVVAPLVELEFDEPKEMLATALSLAASP